MTEPAIVTEGLHKRFGNVTALDGVDLSVDAGTAFGLLGPNGAGKTTAVRILTTILRPDAGTARVLGHDVTIEPEAVRASIGLAGQYAAVDENLTGRENLRMVGRLGQLPGRAARRRADELLEQFGLAEAGSRRGPTPEGCAGASTWLPPWWDVRPCCSSTNPRPAWTPGAGASSGG
jgi:ABC-type multidrug transport system ATPase subunit